MLYDKVDWPAGGHLMVAPYDPALYDAGAVGRNGLCTWGDDKRPAQWSVVWRGGRWACCDEHRAGYARAELGGDEAPTPVDSALTDEDQ